MCTVSWNWKQDHEDSHKLLRIYFNRDERRVREIAIAPQVIETLVTRILRPVDPKITYQSRGHLVRKVVQGVTLDQTISRVYACISQHLAR